MKQLIPIIFSLLIAFPAFGAAGGRWPSSSVTVSVDSLDAENSAGDEFCLTYELDSDQFQWQSCAAGGTGDEILIDGNAVTDVAGVNFLGSTGITVTFNDVSPDQALFSFDAAEIVGTTTWGGGAGQTWVWDADAGATDPQIVFGSDSIAITNAATFTVDGNAVLDSSTGQPLDSELTTIAGLTETDGAVMFVAGGAWTADTTPAIDCTDCTNIPDGTTHTGTVTWGGTAILESGTAFQFGDGTDATVTYTFANTGTDNVITSSTGVLDVTTGALQVGGNAVLDSTTGQPLDSELTTIAGLTETNDAVMFVAGGAWTADTTPAIDCTDCTNIPAGTSHTGTVTWGGTAILEAGTAFQFGDGTDATVTYTFANTGTNNVITSSTGVLDVTTGALQVGGNVVLDSSTGQPLDSELTTIAGLTETNDAVMFVAGGAWTADTTPAIDCTDCINIPAGSTHTGTVTWGGTAILESGTAFQFGDGTDATVTYTFANTGTNNVITSSTGVLDVTTGALQVGGNVVLDSSTGQPLDSELTTIAGLTETNDAVMFVAGGAWTADTTPAIDCTDCINIPAGSTHTGTVTWGGTAILESGAAFQFGDGTDATITHTYANTGNDVTIAYSTDTMTVTGDVVADSFTTGAIAAPSVDFDDSDDTGTIEGSINVNCPTANDCDMDFAVNSGADTETTMLRIDTETGGASVVTIGTGAVGATPIDRVEISETGSVTFAGSGDIDLPADSVDESDLNITGDAPGAGECLTFSAGEQFIWATCAGTSHTGTVTWGGTAILEAGTAFQFGDGTDATVTYTFANTGTNNVITSSTGVLDVTTGALQVGGNVVLDSSTGQPLDSELTTIAGLTETNDAVMFVAGGAWTADTTPAIDCTDCTNIPAGTSHTGTVTWGGTAILESGTAFQFGDGTDATVTYTFANTGTDNVITSSTGVLDVTTGALQVGGNVVLDSTTGQPLDSELTTIAGLTETNDAVMFVAGGAWTADLTPAIDCTDCTNIPDGTTHTGTVTWGGTAILESGAAFQFGDGTDATVTYTFANTGTNHTMVASSNTMTFSGDVVANSLTAGAAAAPSIEFDDSDSASETVDASIVIQATDTGAGTEDVDVTVNTQVASTLTARLTIDADGQTQINNADLEVNATDPADTGAIRLDNAAAIAWEASPTGTDVTLAADASEIIQITGGSLDAADLSGTLAAGVGLSADQVDALTEIAQGIKTAANDTDDLAVWTGALPGSNVCVEMNSTGQLVTAGNTCANLGPGGTTTIDALGDAGGIGAVTVGTDQEYGQTWTWNTPATTVGALDALTLDMELDATTDAQTQGVLVVGRSDGAGTTALESLVRIENNEVSASVTNGIQMTSAAGTIDVAINVNDAQIDNVFELQSAVTISDAELARLDGKDAALIDANDTSAGVTTLTGTTLTLGDGGDFTTLTFNAGGTDPVITSSTGVLNVSTGALQVGGNAVLDSTTGQPLDSELTTIAGLTETNDAVMFVAGGAWTADLTPAIDCTDCINIPAGTSHTGTVTWGGTAILESGTAFQFGDGTDATVTYTFANTGTNNVITSSTGVLNVSTGALQVGGNVVLDSTTGQPLDSELTTIAGLTETNDAVMFVAGGAWTADTTPAIDCTDCINIPAGTSHTGTVTWGGTAILESGAAFQFGDGTDATVTYTFANTGTDNVITSSTGVLDVSIGALQVGGNAVLDAGGTVDLTAEQTVDGAGLEFLAEDVVVDCNTFSATGGGIYYDDSRNGFQLCAENVVQDLGEELIGPSSGQALVFNANDDVWFSDQDKDGSWDNTGTGNLESALNNGESYIYAEHYLNPGGVPSTTCGLQEAINTLSGTSRKMTIYMAPTNVCTNMTGLPIAVPSNTGLTIIGPGGGNVNLTPGAELLYADTFASGTDVTITINESGQASEVATITRSAGDFTPGGSADVEVGHWIRMEDEHGEPVFSASDGANNRPMLVTAVNANGLELTVADPGNTFVDESTVAGVTYAASFEFFRFQGATSSNANFRNFSIDGNGQAFAGITFIADTTDNSNSIQGPEISNVTFGNPVSAATHQDHAIYVAGEGSTPTNDQAAATLVVQHSRFRGWGCGWFNTVQATNMAYRDVYCTPAMKYGLNVERGWLNLEAFDYQALSLDGLGDPGAVSTQADASTTGNLEDALQSWTPDEWIGYTVEIVDTTDDAAPEGEKLTILDNDTDTLNSLDGTWTAEPDEGDYYMIYSSKPDAAIYYGEFAGPANISEGYFELNTDQSSAVKCDAAYDRGLHLDNSRITAKASPAAKAIGTQDWVNCATTASAHLIGTTLEADTSSQGNLVIPNADPYVELDTLFYRQGSGYDLTVLDERSTPTIVTLNADQTDDADATDNMDALQINIASESGDAGDTLEGLVITYANGTANTILDAGIRIDNAETTASTLTDAIIITSSGVDAGVTDAIDVSAANITNAINIGSNLIVHTGGSVTTSDLDIIDDGDIDVADLSTGTDGQLITWDASSNPATVATGTDGQFLESNGAGAAPAFRDFVAADISNISANSDITADLEEEGQINATAVTGNAGAVDQMIVGTTTNTASWIDMPSGGTSGCSGATTDKVLYNSSTDTWSCGTDADSGGAPAWSAITAPSGDLTLGMAENNTTFNWTKDDDAAEAAYTITYNLTAASTAEQELLVLQRLDSGGDHGDMDQLLHIENIDTNDAVVSGILIDSAAGTIGVGIDVSDAEIDTALSIGTNDIVTGAATIASTELDLLDGRDTALVDTTDAVNTAIIGTGTVTTGTWNSAIASGTSASSTTNVLVIDTDADASTTDTDVLTYYDGTTAYLLFGVDAYPPIADTNNRLLLHNGTNNDMDWSGAASGTGGEYLNGSFGSVATGALVVRTAGGDWADANSANLLTTQGTTLTLGDGDDFTTLTFDAGVTDPVLTASSGALTLSTGDFAIGGTNPADAGALRLENDAQITWEDTEGTGEVSIGFDATETLEVTGSEAGIALTTTTAKECVMLDAAGINCATTTGCEVDPNVQGTNFDFTVALFEGSTDSDEDGAWSFNVPDNITGTTFVANYYWSTNATIAAGENEVCFAVQSAGIADNAAWDALTFGTAEGETDTATTASSLYVSPDFTVTHGWVANERAAVRIYRDNTTAFPTGCTEDDIDVDVELHALKVCYDVNNVFSGE